MQILPQFDPWGNIGQQFGSGIGNYLTQATDRNRLQGALGVAQQLMQPTQDGQPQASPGQIYAQLAGAFAGIPGGLQHLSEIFPLLLQQRNVQARGRAKPNVTYGQGAQRGRPGQGILPDGQRPNVPPRGPRGQRTPNGFQQDSSPYNEQPYAMESGGGYPGGQDQQPVVERPGTGTQRMPAAGQTQSDEFTINPLARPGTTGPHQALPHFSAKDMEAFRADLQREGILTEDQIIKVMDQVQKNVEGEQQSILRGQELDQRDIELNRALDKTQQEFLGNQFSRLSGGLDKEGNPINPDSEWNDPQTRRVALTNFLKARGMRENETDAKAWRQAEKETERYVNARKNIKTVRGRPAFGQDYDRLYSSAKDTAQAFLRATPNGIESKTGDYDLEAVKESIASLMENGWLYEEAAEMTTPMSKKTVDAIHAAPNLGKMYPLGIAGERNTEDPKLQKEYQRTADLIMKGGVPNWDNLSSLRRQLFMQKGWLSSDFQALLDTMQARGWTPSTYQDQHLGRLQADIKPPLYEIMMEGGRGWKQFFTEPKRL